MKYRLFGRSNGLRVSEMALGGGATGSAFPNGIGAERSREVFDVFAEAGGNFIDTSSAYQAGESEQLIGEFVGKDRDNFVIGTKYSVGVTRTEHYAVRGNGRKAMMVSIEGSLRRLNTDYVDILWLHGHDAMTPMDEILRGLDDLVRSGKVMHVGFSNFPAWRLSRGALLAELKNYAPIAGIQIEYSAAEREPERDLIPMAEALGIGITLWSPLSGGFLAGLPKPGLPHWTQNGRPTEQDFAVQAAVRKVAEELGVKPAQVGIAWLYRRFASSAVSAIPIMGARDGAEMKELLDCIDLDLTQEQFDAIDQSGPADLGQLHAHNRLSQFLLDAGDHHPPIIPPA